MDVGAELLPQLFGKSLVEYADLAVAYGGGLLLAQNQVHDLVVLELHLSALHGAGTGGHEAVACPGDALAMPGHEVEGVAGYYLVNVAGAAGAVGVAGILVEVGLVTGEADVADVRHSEVLLAVEAGAAAFAEMGRGRDAVETIDDEHGLTSVTGIAQGQHLAREA